MKSSWQIKIKIFLKEFKTVMFSREKKKAEAICNTKDKSKQNQQQAGVSSTLETTHARNDGENWQEHTSWSVIVSDSIDRMFQGVAPDCRWDVSGEPCHVYKYHTGGVVTLISPSPPQPPMQPGKQLECTQLLLLLEMIDLVLMAPDTEYFLYVIVNSNMCKT